MCDVSLCAMQDMAVRVLITPQLCTGVLPLPPPRPAPAPAAGACSAGFTGNACAVCTTSNACVQSTSNSAATCLTSFAYAANSQRKSYTCRLTQTFLTNLIVPDSLLVQCATGLNATLGALPASGGGGGGSGSCNFSFVVNSTRVPVECKTAGCVINPNSTLVSCASSTCSCPSGPDGKCGSGEWLFPPWAAAVPCGRLPVLPVQHCTANAARS